MNTDTSNYTEQPSAADTTSPQHPLFGFFAIGIAVNVVLIAAYLVWAFRQWKKKGRAEP